MNINLTKLFKLRSRKTSSIQNYQKCKQSVPQDNVNNETNSLVFIIINFSFQLSDKTSVCGTIKSSLLHSGKPASRSSSFPQVFSLPINT